MTSVPDPVPYRALLDCDGVLAGFDYVHDRIYEKFGFLAPHTGDSHEYMTPEQQAYLHEILSTPGTATQLRPLQYAVDGVSRLRELGAKYGRLVEVKCVTASWPNNPTWETDRRVWLKTHFGLGDNDVLFVPTGEKKWVYGDLFIDDRAHVVRDWCARHPESTGWVYSHLFNEKDTWPKWTWQKFLDGAITAEDILLHRRPT